MMERLNIWIIGITCASMILAAVQTLVPEGALHKVVNLAGGLMLLLAVVTPLIQLDGEQLSLAFTEYRMVKSESADLLRLENKQIVMEIAEEQTAAYVLEKIGKMGLVCTVEVRCTCDEEGSVFLNSVTIGGSLPEREKLEVSGWIERELGVETQFEEGDAP